MTSNTTARTSELTSALSEHAWLRAATLLVAGALQTLTFSPFNWWWLGPLSVALILFCCLPLAPQKLFRAGWLVGLGLFGTGASWVYISISEHGNTSVPLAIILTVIFVSGLALFHGLAFWDFCVGTRSFPWSGVLGLGQACQKQRGQAAVPVSGGMDTL